MFIQTHDTPNPRTLKFTSGEAVMPEGTRTFADQEMAKASPLATVIFTIDGVESVFFGADFVSVTKSAEADWEQMKPKVITSIMDHYITEQPILHDLPKKEPASATEVTAIEKEIIELIDTRVRPAVAEDGGDIIFNRFEEGVVYLELLGACSGCPSSTMTLKDGVENLLKHYIPEVEHVEAVGGPDAVGDL